MPPKSGESDLKNSVKEPVKDLTAEVVSGIVSRVTRAATRRAINELKKKLGGKSLAGLQKQLETISEQKLENFVKGNADRLADEVSRGRISEDRIILNIEQDLRQSLQRWLSNMAKSPLLKVILITAIIIVAIGVPVAATTLTSEPEPDDTVPPQVEVFVEPEIPRPDETVTFVVEAFDDVEVDWIELVVNGELVREGGESPLVFTGGPYPEGTSIVYSATAYDVAGNDAGTGEQALQIAVSIGSPDLVVLEGSHEWVNFRAGLVVIRYVMQNRGESEAGPSVTVLRLGDQVIAEESVGALRPGEITEREFPPVELSPNGFVVELCADAENVVEEADEDNNCLDYRG